MIDASVTRRCQWLAAALAMLASLALQASTGHPAAPAVQLQLALTSTPELKTKFLLRGSAKFLLAARSVTLSIVTSGSTELLEGGKSSRPAAERGDGLEVLATLRAVKPASGEEVRLVARFVEVGPGGAATEERVVTQSLFLTVTEAEGGEGLPADLWSCWWQPPDLGPDRLVLRDYGPVEAGRGEVAAGLSRYTELLAMLRLGGAATAATGFDTLSASNDPELAVAAGNAAAVACYASGKRSAAEDRWAKLLWRADLPGRIAAYLFFNRAVARARLGDRKLACADLASALGRHPGFSAARRLLERLR